MDVRAKQGKRVGAEVPEAAELGLVLNLQVVGKGQTGENLWKVCRMRWGRCRLSWHRAACTMPGILHAIHGKPLELFPLFQFSYHRLSASYVLGIEMHFPCIPLIYFSQQLCKADLTMPILQKRKLRYTIQLRSYSK